MEWTAVCSTRCRARRALAHRPPSRSAARPHRAQEVTQNATNRTMDVSITMDSSQSMSATMWQNTKDAVATLLDALHAETSAVRRPRSPAPRPPVMTRLMALSCSLTAESDSSSASSLSSTATESQRGQHALRPCASPFVADAREASHGCAGVRLRHRRGPAHEHQPDPGAGAWVHPKPKGGPR